MKKLLAVILTVVMSLAMTACGERIDPPDKVVESALTAIKASDFETASNYFDTDPKETLDAAEDDQSDEIKTKLMQGLEYSIISTEENGDTATVKTNIKNIDMSTVISDYINQAFEYVFSGLSEDELNEKFIEILNTSMDNNKDNLIEKEVDIKLTKGEAGWIITMDDDLADAITGGMLTMAKNFNAAADSSDISDSNS